MRFKSISFVCVLILFFALCLRSNTGLNEKEDLTQVYEKIMAKMVLANEDMEKKAEKMKGLAEQIVCDNKKFTEHFTKREFKGMAKLLGKRSASLMTRGYKKMYGKESESFWNETWSEGKIIKFKPVHIYLSDVVEKGEGLKKAEGEERMVFDCVAYAIQEIHIISKEEGKIAHNATILGIWTFKHQDACPWL